MENELNALIERLDGHMVEFANGRYPVAELLDAAADLISFLRAPAPGLLGGHLIFFPISENRFVMRDFTSEKAAREWADRFEGTDYHYVDVNPLAEGWEVVHAARTHERSRVPGTRREATERAYVRLPDGELRFQAAEVRRVAEDRVLEAHSRSEPAPPHIVALRDALQEFELSYRVRTPVESRRPGYVTTQNWRDVEMSDCGCEYEHNGADQLKVCPGHAALAALNEIYDLDRARMRTPQKGS